MKKILLDKEAKRLITIYTISGILIAIVLALVFNVTHVMTFLKNLFLVLLPFVWGILFAIIVFKPANLIENILPKSISLRFRRFIGALICTLVLIAFVSVAIVIIAPSVLDSLASLSVAITKFAENPTTLLNSLQKTFNLSTATVTYLHDFFSGFIQSLWLTIQNFIPNILSATIDTVGGIFDFVLGFIICLYILMDKQKIAIAVKRVSMVILDEKKYAKGRPVMYLALEKFTNFFSGKLLDSLIIGIICFIAMLFINTEYAVLISVVVGITNIIPFFGPFIGAIPCALILLIVNPSDCLWFVIMIIILQQLDGNIIGPKILGDSVGLSSILIVFAIIVGGSYFGFFGMLLSVPIFSVIYYVVKEYIDQKLADKKNVTE